MQLFDKSLQEKKQMRKQQENTFHLKIYSTERTKRIPNKKLKVVALRLTESLLGII